MNPCSKLVEMIKRSSSLHRDEDGAFLLLGLIAILIVAMMTLAMLDTGKATRDKVRAQVATDTSAYSASSIRARSMNAIAFANVAKRTIVGVVVGYENMWRLFDTVYKGARLTSKFPPKEELKPLRDAGRRVVKDIEKLWKSEKKRAQGV